LRDITEIGRKISIGMGKGHMQRDTLVRVSMVMRSVREGEDISPSPLTSLPLLKMNFRLMSNTYVL